MNNSILRMAIGGMANSGMVIALLLAMMLSAQGALMKEERAVAAGGARKC